MLQLKHVFVLTETLEKEHQQMTLPTKDTLDFPDFSHFSKVYLFQIVI